MSDESHQDANSSAGVCSGADYRNADLRKAQLGLVDLRKANFEGANLTGAYLTGAVLSGANLAGANLKNASLVRARFDGAILTGANLHGADLRGAQGLTAEQVHSAKNNEAATLDEKTLKMLGRTGDMTLARHGKPPKKTKKTDPPQIDFIFTKTKPRFEDLLNLIADMDIPPAGEIDGFGFRELVDLGIDQVDDYYAVCNDGDPAVWILPLVKGEEVFHHSGPYDGLRLVADSGRYKQRWAKCVARFEKALRVPFRKELDR